MDENDVETDFVHQIEGTNFGANGAVIGDMRVEHADELIATVLRVISRRTGGNRIRIYTSQGNRAPVLVSQLQLSLFGANSRSTKVRAMLKGNVRSRTVLSLLYSREELWSSNLNIDGKTTRKTPMAVVADEVMILLIKY